MHLQDTEWIVVVAGIAAFLNSVTVGESRSFSEKHKFASVKILPVHSMRVVPKISHHNAKMLDC